MVPRMHEITIELPDNVILQLALIAHEQHITLNQLLINILEERLKQYGYNENCQGNEAYKPI